MGVVGSASAHDVDFESRVLITGTTPTEDGVIVLDQVKSKNDECVEGRKVVLYREKGRKDKEKVGEDRTDESGRSEITVKNPIKHGDYYEKLTSKELKESDEHEHTCDGAKSGGVIL